MNDEIQVLALLALISLCSVGLKPGTISMTFSIQLKLEAIDEMPVDQNEW